MQSSPPPLLEDLDLPSSPPLPQSSLNLATLPSQGRGTSLTRPNRFLGPDSTWLTWTKEERGAVEALDEARAENLSVHLFNDHGLRRAARIADSSHRGRRRGKRRADYTSDEQNDGKQSIYCPSKGWTAWPLPPDEVPRDEETTGVDIASYVPLLDPRPSAVLEEELLAHVMRVARERWNAREWVSVPKDAPPKSDAKEDVAQESATVAEVGPTADAAETQSSDSELGEGMLVSQVYLADSDEDNAGDEKRNVDAAANECDEDQIPTPMADDDEARKLAIPSIRQTMSKLDDLLLALHTARRSYSSVMPAESGGYETYDTDTTATEVSRPLKRRRARSRSRSRMRTQDDAEIQESQSVPHELRRGMGLRNWGDVLGIAAMIGWDADTLAAARKRCANIFAENMTLLTIDEPRPRQKESNWQEFEAVDDSADSSGDEVAVEGFVTRIRSSGPCKLCREAKAKCEADPDPTSTSTSCLRCKKYHETCSGIGTQNINLACPHRDCDRHKKPFGKLSHLQRHVDDVHGRLPVRPPTSPVFPSSPSEGYQSGSNDYFCPVNDCPRRYKPFDRGARMYDHVRKMHPEVDVEAVKRNETARRGERRGRPRDPSKGRAVGRRTRSRSSALTSSPPQVISSSSDGGDHDDEGE